MTHSKQAALRGEPSYVWRSGQNRRMNMMAQWGNLRGRVLDNGCGLGMYLRNLEGISVERHGLEVEFERAVEARPTAEGIVNAVGETLPYASNSFDFVLSNEVIEHVRDDQLYMREMVRVCKVGGRIMVFCPNRWNLFEQHGIYLGDRYIFGNIPFVNYLPNDLRDRLAPHVRAYRQSDLIALFNTLPVKVVHLTRIFRGFDNIERRLGAVGRLFKNSLYTLENTSLNLMGYSHLLVLEKKA